MESGKGNLEEREEEEANNSSVLFSALRENVFEVLDFMEGLKNDEDQKAVDVDLIEKLKFKLTFVCTYVQFPYSDLERFKDVMTRKRYVIIDLLEPIVYDADIDPWCKYSMQRAFSSLRYNMYDCISSHHHSKSSATMTEEQLDFLLLNLYHLSKYLAEKVFPLVVEYEILRNICGNIKDLHGLIVQHEIVEREIVEYAMPQIQLMAERVGHFIWDSQLSKLDEGDQADEVSQIPELAHLFLKIIPIELEVMLICHTNLKASPSAEVEKFIKKLLEISPDVLIEYLIHLQEHMVTVITPGTSGARNIHVMIEFLLIILSDVPKDFIHHDKLFDLLARVGALIKEVSTLACGLEEKSRNKESSDETNRATLDLLESIELLKEDFKHVYLTAPDSSQLCFPMTDGPLFMNLLLIHLNDLLDSNSYSVALIREEIKLVKEDLNFIRPFLIDVVQELYKDLWKRVLDVAYEAKHVIDSIIVRDDGLLHLVFSLPITIKKIKVIREDVSHLPVKIPENRSLIAVNSLKKPVESKSVEAGKVIVGFEEETDWIIRNLTSGLADLDVISITGMPGSGKTTLAYKVYNDESVISHFDVRAWCTVDQEYEEKKLLVKLFNQVTDSDPISSEDTDVADKLRKQLYGRRYLIVLDDVWDTTAWDELTRPFPLVEEGSRIILTTREMEVALHGKCNTEPLKLRLLSDEESWELLEKRVFGKESCPDELLDVGKEIAQNCKGLPLVVDLIAGVIAGKEKKLWLEVQNNLNSFVFNSAVDVTKVIKLSYDHLSDHLKPFFIYLASFPKDTAIKISWLIVNWGAEGFVDQTEMKSVEKVMKVYLDNLISSSLVIFSDEIDDGPTCQLHDLVHDFCLTIAREEKLFDRISSRAPSSLSSSDLMPRKVIIHFDKEHFSPNNFVLFNSKEKRQSGKHLYSLEITGHKLDNRIRHLRLLRVLDLDSSFIVNDSLLNAICMLNHLRYLSVGTEVKFLPTSFSNLWNLETLVVSNSRSTMVLLPRIWDLAKLRVLMVGACSFFDMDSDEPIVIAEDSKLENLRMLETLVLSYSEDTEDIFKRFPNLQRLRISLRESWDDSTERYWFPKLDLLTELEVLEVELQSGSFVAENWSWDFHFPSNLKALVLSNFPLTSDSLSTIARLPNLEMLGLGELIIQGGVWNMREEDTFEKLKRLVLDGVNFSKWEVGEESFPMLERLEFWRCRKLREIPPSFGDVLSLKTIKLYKSGDLCDSALDIKEYVENMAGEDRLQVLDRNDQPLYR